MAKALRHDRKRLTELQTARDKTKAAETQEERFLRSRIAENAKTIQCPADYGFKERWDDDARLARLRPDGFDETISEYSIPPAPYYDFADADAEEMQLMARIEAFDHSPEGLARARIQELIKNSVLRWMSADKHNELDRLITLYPEPWWNPNCVWYDGIKHGTFYTPEGRRRAAEEDQRIFNNSKSLQRRAALGTL